MDQARVNVLQAVRFLPDVLDEINENVSPLEQTNSLLIANSAFRIRALRFRMKLVFRNEIAIRLESSQSR
jgi:hypothetical protein